MIDLLAEERVRVFGTIILLIIITLDFILSHDKKTGNTPREWLMAQTQKQFGVFVPYALGVLMGHFYHLPGTETILGLSLVASLSIVFVLGLLVVLLSRQAHLPINKYLFVAFFGILIGNLVWPV